MRAGFAVFEEIWQNIFTQEEEFPKEDHLPPMTVEEYFEMAAAAAPLDPHLHNEYGLAM